MNNSKRLLILLKPHKRIMLSASVFLIAASATNLAMPLLVKQLVDVVMVQKSLEKLNQITLTISTLLLAQMVFSTLNNYLFDRTEKRIITDFRKTFFQ